MNGVPAPVSTQQFAPSPALRESESAEAGFFENYSWSLDPNPTSEDAAHYLWAEIDKLPEISLAWQFEEVAVNIYLLGCALVNAADEVLRGPVLRMPRRIGQSFAARNAKAIAEAARNLRSGRAHLRQWRESMLQSLNNYLAVYIKGANANRAELTRASAGFLAFLPSPLPSRLRARQISIPSPFRRLDLTPLDAIALAQRLVQRVPARNQRLLLVGLRSSGTYIALLVRAHLQSEGFLDIGLLTIEPNAGPGTQEAQSLKDFARRGYMAVLIDDPPHSGGTLLAAIAIARRAGFATKDIRALVPIGASERGALKSLPPELVVGLERIDWRINALLDHTAVEQRLFEYFGGDRGAELRVLRSPRAEALNAEIAARAQTVRGSRSSRIYELRLSAPQGREQTLFVIAMSAGCGWLGYPAFLAARRLAGMTPRVFGLREGVLYMEWLPQIGAVDATGEGGRELIGPTAAYLAARVERLRLERNPLLGEGQQRHHNGVRLLQKSLGRAYGPLVARHILGKELGRKLRRLACPLPTLIDGDMALSKWLAGPKGPVKTAFAQHGLGKGELNVVDPAYDLADAIFNLALSPVEEQALIDRYVLHSGDAGVADRLFPYKWLAGLWAMEKAQNGVLDDGADADGRQAQHRRFIETWDFLTLQSARWCGRLLPQPRNPGWREPVIFLDIDGVIDTRIFGFPTTTSAGIAALSLLRQRGFSIALNTARSVVEVQNYCAAYGLAGGVAEYGAYVWDALAGEGRALIGEAAIGQLQTLRDALRRIPGVYLDDRHRYSLRAFTYRRPAGGLLATLAAQVQASSLGDGALSPLPLPMVQDLMNSLHLDLLCYRQTGIDTSFSARETDKGVGLAALRDWVLEPNARTIAVGDSRADLTMFQRASQCFAPANISCAAEAKLFNCHIARHKNQRGLLEIARHLAGREGGKPDASLEPPTARLSQHDLIIFDLLRAADRSEIGNLAAALYERATIGLARTRQAVFSHRLIGKRPPS